MLVETTSWFNEDVVALKAGTILGEKYELLQQVGRGGMGVVWKAQDRVADRLVALKFVPSDLSRFDDEMQRVRESFKKVHALQHQSICPLYSLEDGKELGYYLVMKFLEGESLEGYVRRKSPNKEGLPLEQVVNILSRVALALDYAHTSGVIHRDIKPGNIFLVRDKNRVNIQVIDFGLADDIRDSLVRVSQVRVEISGTRPYMSPEQWRGRPQSATTDQYALAVVAYELLAGRLPFANSDTQLLRLAVLCDMPERIASLSDEANDVLFRALAKESSDRFGSCRDFIMALHGSWTSIGSSGVSSASSSARGSSAEYVPYRGSFFGFSLSDIIPTRVWMLLVSVVFAVVFAVVFGLVVSLIPPKTTVSPPSDSSLADINVGEGQPAEGQAQAEEQAVAVAEPLPEVIAPEQANRRPQTTTTPPRSNAAPLTPPVPYPEPTAPKETRFPDIFAAAARGTPGDVKYFLDRGAKINAVAADDQNGQTLLHCAVGGRLEGPKYRDMQFQYGMGHMGPQSVDEHFRMIEVIKYLLSKGADVNAKNRRNETPLFLFVAQGPPPSATTMQSVAEILLSHGADINEQPSPAAPPLLFFLAQRGMLSEGLLQTFISHGFDVNATNHQGDTLLDTLPYVGNAPPPLPLPPGHPEQLRMQAGTILRNAGAKHGSIHGAARNGTVEEVQSFLNRRVDINTKNSTGESALHVAVRSYPPYNTEVVKMLISRGANVNIGNNHGETPLDICRSSELTAILVQAGAKNGSLHGAVRTGTLNDVRGFIDRRSDVNAKDRNNSLPIHIAADRSGASAVEIMKLLVSRGADVNAENSYKSTPLHIAAERSNVEMVRYLVSVRGIKVNAVNSSRKTPLECVPGGDSANVNTIRSLLRTAGAASGTRTSSTNTPTTRPTSTPTRRTTTP